MTINEMMHAMILEKPGERLQMKELPVPIAGPEGVLIRIHACGVCRTDLHIIDGELPHPKLPLIPGHEIIGTVVEKGEQADGFAIGQRIGVPWLGYTDGQCSYCKRDKENLCENAKFTGYTLDGGCRLCGCRLQILFSVLPSYKDAEAAPLMCAGLIGYRSYRLATAEPGVERLGIYGFGAAAHIICQVWQ